jgi:hypothetical protein
MFSSWLNGIGHKLRNQILLGAVELCWALWLNRNDVVFDNVKSNTYLQAISRATYWKEEHPLFKRGNRDLEIMIMVVFVKFGWCFRNRIEV